MVRRFKLMAFFSSKRRGIQKGNFRKGLDMIDGGVDVARWSRVDVMGGEVIRSQCLFRRPSVARLPSQSRLHVLPSSSMAPPPRNGETSLSLTSISKFPIMPFTLFTLAPSDHRHADGLFFNVPIFLRLSSECAARGEIIRD